MAESNRDYQVELEVFRGPLDLLLYLVKRDEVDIRDIPIARVAKQFQDYLEVLHLLDVERVGDFLVMAATLMEIKSKMLLPGPEELDEEEEDPRAELVRQLIEYKRFKEASSVLEGLAEEQSRRLPREPVVLPKQNGPQPLRPVELWDLVSAFGRLMRETLTSQSTSISMDHTPIHVYTEQIVAKLEHVERMPFSSLFEPPHTKARLVGMFLAVLELARRFRLLTQQDDSFGEFYVSLAPERDEEEEEPIAEHEHTEDAKAG